MTDYPSLPTAENSEDADERIVYVRSVRTADLPEAIREQTSGMDELYAIYASSGECLALVPDRRQAFVVARRNELSPVSVH